MSKTVLVASIKKLGMPGPINPEAFNLEEVALLRTLYEQKTASGSGVPGEQKLLTRIEMLVASWNGASADSDQDKRSERRTQLVLREAIDCVLEERWEDLSSPAEHLIRATYGTLTERAPFEKGSREERLLELLDKAVHALDGRTQSRDFHRHEGHSEAEVSAEVEGTWETISYTHTVDPDTDFRNIQRSTVHLLHEIEVDLNARRFDFEGNTCIQGDVPSDVLIDVANGHLRVEGNVLGTICATGSIEIDGNVQGGTVISLEGDIHCRFILLRSRVIAQAGSVECDRAEVPEPIFAWELIRIREQIIDGRICARNVIIDGHAPSVAIHACGSVSVQRLESGKRGPALVCLRDRIEYRDYHRKLQPEVEDKYVDLDHLISKIRRTTDINSATLNLMRNCYRTAAFYLLGGVENAASAMNLMGLQTRGLHLSQILAVAETAARQYRKFLDRDRWDVSEAAQVDELEEMLNNIREPLGAIQKDVEALPQEFDSTHRRYLIDRCAELRTHLKNLVKDFSKRDDAVYLTDVFQPALTSWREAVRESERAVRVFIRKSGIGKDMMERLQNEPESLPDLVEDLVKEKSASENWDERGRATSPLIRLLQDSAERYQRAMEQGEETVQKANTELRELRKQLSAASVVQFAGSGTSAPTLTFDHADAGVVITADADKTRGTDAKIGAALEIVETIDERAVYLRQKAFVMRKT